MNGLDLGTLAGYHRRNLADEMHKGRVAAAADRGAADKRDGTQPSLSLRVSLGIAIERWGRWLQGNVASRASWS